jgi:DNA gyrase subunit B
VHPARRRPPGREGHRGALSGLGQDQHSRRTFSNLDYSFKTLENRLRELAFLNSGVRIMLEDEAPRRAAAVENCSTKAACGNSSLPRPVEDPVMPEPIYMVGERDGIGVEVAMWWNDSYHETVLPFTNNIPQRDGGTHLAGFRGALTRTINAYAQSSASPRRRRSTSPATTRARG